jgi:hypothetical protein
VRAEVVGWSLLLLEEGLSGLHTNEKGSRRGFTEGWPNSPPTLAFHRLVQTVMCESMPVEAQGQWMQRAVHTVAEAFPESPDFANWPIAERLLPQALS